MKMPGISSGTTRVVLFWGNYALKIVRIRPLRGLKEALKAKRGRKLGSKGFLRFWIGSALWGIRVNRGEYFAYCAMPDDHPDKRKLVPTIGLYLYGFAIVQLRCGREISETELQTILNSGSIKELRKADLAQKHQYCIHPTENRPVVVDYGDPRTLSALKYLKL